MSFEKEHLTRQLDIIPLSVLGTPITIVGAGAIGSFTALTLAKMGFEDIEVYDNDKVDTVNLNCQFFRHSDVGEMKVRALGKLIQDFTGVKITERPYHYASNITPRKGILVAAVDSMEARKMIWGTLKDKAPQVRLLVDPRMGAEAALCYAMNPMEGADQASYEKTLYSDSQAVQERCTAKATMYTACMLSGQVAKTVKDFLTGNYPRVVQWAIDKDCFQAWRTQGLAKTA